MKAIPRKRKTKKAETSVNATLQSIADKLKRAESVAIFSHMRPDGDAYGSALALSRALDVLGIRNFVCIESDCPSNLTFIRGVEKVQKKLAFDAQVYVALDCADEERLGALTQTFREGKRKKLTVNVDHHVSNPRYAQLNFVHECASNCLNVYWLISYMGVPIDAQIAEYLMIGLLTDSGNFSHDDVTGETLRVAAELMEAGANLSMLIERLFKKQPKQRAALYAETMSKMRYFHNDRFALIVITQEAMQRHGADYGMTEGFVDFPLSVDSVEVSASLLEMRKGQYKISLRSKRYADVNKIASVYGGGGHMRASGCMLHGGLEDVIDRLSYTVSQYLED